MVWVFSNQGRYGKALEWYIRAFGGREKALGVNYLYILSTFQNMAWVFSNQGRYGKALEWYDRALAGQEQALGGGSPIDTTYNTFPDLPPRTNWATRTGS